MEGVGGQKLAANGPRVEDRKSVTEILSLHWCFARRDDQLTSREDRVLWLEGGEDCIFKFIFTFYQGEKKVATILKSYMKANKNYSFCVSHHLLAIWANRYCTLSKYDKYRFYSLNCHENAARVRVVDSAAWYVYRPLADFINATAALTKAEGAPSHKCDARWAQSRRYCSPEWEPRPLGQAHFPV